MSKRDPLESTVREVLTQLGQDPQREGLCDTPGRVTRSLRFLTGGYDSDPAAILNSAVFEESYNEMVLVKDIDFYSLCEHHLLPFFGRAHVAYIPDGRIVGLSKLPRLVDLFARRLQVQERLTVQIAETVEQVLRPRGVGVVLEANHLCMMMRGVEQQNAFAITSSMRGSFSTDSRTRAELMQLIRHRRALSD